MSKNTKIIAIVGGVLILGFVVWTIIGGGFGQAFEAVGCGGKKEPKKPRVNIEGAELSECLNYSYACVRDDKGVPKKASGAKECDKKPKDYCKKLWSNKCKDKKFASENKTGCKKFSAKDEKDDD